MMAMMDVVAQLTFTAGPDRGKSLRLAEEIVHLGRGAQNHVVLSDPALSDHQASIVYRNGRYAIYAPLPGMVNVDGNALPAERWVWLPIRTIIRLGLETELMFEVVEDGESTAGRATIVLPAAKLVPPPPAPAAESPAVPPALKLIPPAPPGGAASGAKEGSSVIRKRRRPDKAKRKTATSEGSIARFITDRPGDPLVKLGEDGQLPELMLESTTAPTDEVRRKPGNNNPALLYGALAFSLVMSLGMLLIEPGGPHFSHLDRSSVRQEVVAYFGDEGELQPYQQLLRQALIEHARGDYAAERDLYRRVLRMLNSADIIDPENLNGLTGRQTGRGRKSDEQLRELLEKLVAR